MAAINNDAIAIPLAKQNCVCDITRLKRFLVIGSENGSLNVSAAENIKQNIECLNRLINDGHGDAVLKCLEDFSVDRRVSKETPILQALSLCATFPGKVDLQRAAYEKVAKICNIPTKLFQFIDFCQKRINAKRKSDPPKRQPSKKRPRVEESMASLDIDKTPTENEEEEESDQPSPSKKRRVEKKRTLKKVNTKPKRSSGWGRMRRKAIGSFYKSHKPERLLCLLTKYKQRHNWNHKQVLGYAHPKITDEDDSVKQAKDFVLTYTTRGYEKLKERSKEYRNENGSLLNGSPQVIATILSFIDILHEVSQLNPQEGEVRLLKILECYGVRDQRKEFSEIPHGACEPKQNPEGLRCALQVVREHIPTGFLKSKKVWEALLKDMPMTHMMRNLGKMSSIDLFETKDEDNVDDNVADNSNENPDPNNNVMLVRDALENATRLKQANVHPIKILIALQKYKQGKTKNKNGKETKWKPNKHILQALNTSFHLSFKQADIQDDFKTGKNYMLCLNVNPSMRHKAGCFGCDWMTPAMASVAMALITLNIEDNVEIMAFGQKLVRLNGQLKKDMSINKALEITRKIEDGTINCSLPMTVAWQQKKEIDVFIIYTDSITEPTNQRTSPSQALQQYNERMDKNAKLIVCAMRPNKFTIADPENPNMLEICGFDKCVPEVIANFCKGLVTGKCDVCRECNEM